jgi:FMN phosphatase YigB (HAD superfamily)
MKMLISDLDDTLFDTTNQLDETYSNIRHIKPFEGALELLTLPNFHNFLVSAGDIHIQTIKLGILKLGHLFHGIYVIPTNKEKLFVFKELLRTHGQGISLDDIFVIGNRVDSEIRYGTMLGLRTILVSQGKYTKVKPKDALEMPTYTVATLNEAAELLRQVAIENQR